MGGGGFGGTGAGASSFLMRDVVVVLLGSSFTLGATLRLKISASWSRAWRSVWVRGSCGVAGVGFFRACMRSLAARWRISVLDVAGSGRC